MGEDEGFTRKDVYIANIVKCRPPGNRDPREDEIASCLPFLRRQIEIISPLAIMSLGRISAHTLMGSVLPYTKFAISRVRGTFFDLVTGSLKIPVMPTFHPAYFLRNRKDKHLTWADAQALLQKLREMEAAG
jgi:DNA polymerase